MIDPNTLREKVEDLKNAVPAIKAAEFVVDDDELSLVLKDHKEGDNMLLGVVLPSYDGFGQEDQSGYRSFLQFFIVEKTDYKTLKGSMYVDIFQRTLVVAREIVRFLFGTDGERCLSLDLDYNSLKIYPVAKKSQCNGYVIEIDEEKFEDF